MPGAVLTYCGEPWQRVTKYANLVHTIRDFLGKRDKAEAEKYSAAEAAGSIPTVATVLDRYS